MHAAMQADSCIGKSLGKLRRKHALESSDSIAMILSQAKCHWIGDILISFLSAARGSVRELCRSCEQWDGSGRGVLTESIGGITGRAKGNFVRFGANFRNKAIRYSRIMTV